MSFIVPYRQKKLSAALGLGLRTSHYHEVLETKPTLKWFEVISENFMGIKEASPGRPLKMLEKFRKDYEIVLHGVSLSIGSADPISKTYLKKLKDLINIIEPAWISDHLCWTGVAGKNFHDLLPIVLSQKALKHVVKKVKQVQDYLERPLLLENASSYISFKGSEMPEWIFLKELSEQSQCGILLDINNIYVSAVNQGFDPIEYINHIPKDRVGQFHLAGYSDQGNFLFDTHDHPVHPPVWKLFEKAVERFGDVPTLIEWDDHLPDFKILWAEGQKAEKIQSRILQKKQPLLLKVPPSRHNTRPGRGASL